MELRKKHRAGELDGYCLYVYVLLWLHTGNEVVNSWDGSIIMGHHILHSTGADLILSQRTIY